MVDLSRFRQRRTGSVPYDKPSRERHFVSILGSVLSMVFLILALALREWAKVSNYNGHCDLVFGLTQIQIQDSSGSETGSQSMTEYYTTSQQILVSCILSVSVLTLLSSVVATLISAGYPRERLEFLRHYAVFNIVSLLCIVLVAGLWLAVAETLPTQKACQSSRNGAKKIEVQFGYAYYILLVGGLFSLGAASFNLLFARSAADRRRSVRHRYRQQQNHRRLTNRTPGPPSYSLVDTTDFSETETETSMSEPEPEASEPNTPPPPYTP